MEIFNYVEASEKKDSFSAWAFIAALADKKPPSEKKLDATKIEVELRFNGEEYSFITVLNRLEEEYDRQVKIAAVKLLGEKLAAVEIVAEDLTSSLRGATDKIRLEFGLERWEVR